MEDRTLQGPEPEESARDASELTAAACRACVIYDESLTSYDFGPTHPMNPIRVDLTMSLARVVFRRSVTLMDASLMKSSTTPAPTTCGTRSSVRKSW